MARIAGVPVGEAGLRVRLVYFFTRRNFARLTGRAPRGVIEPLEIYAHVPGLLRGYGKLEQATAKARRLEFRVVLAQVITCEAAAPGHLSRQQPPEKRAIGKHREAVIATIGQNVLLGGALEQIVGRLRRVQRCDGAEFVHMVRAEIADPDRSDRARAVELRQHPGRCDRALW